PLPPALHLPHAALRDPPAIPALQSASDPKSLRGSRTAQTSKLDRGALLPHALAAPYKAFRRLIANANTAASHAHEQAPVLCVRARAQLLPCTRGSSQSGPSHQLLQHLTPEIQSRASKCFRPPFALQSARKWRSRCPRPNTKSAAS